MRYAPIVAFALMLVLAGCGGQSGGPEQGETGAAEISCTNGDPPTDTELSNLFPEAPEGTTLQDPGYSVSFTEGYEEQAFGVYEASESESYQVSITRWESEQDAQSALEGGILTAAVSGRYAVVVAYDGENGDDATSEDLLLSVPCIDEADMIEGDTISVEPVTVTPANMTNITVSDQ